MKTAKALGAILLGLLAVYGFGRFFLSQLGAPRSQEPAGVIQTAPPGFDVVDRGELSPAGAAEALQLLAVSRPPQSKIGIKFRHAGAEVYWLADLGADTLEERAAGASGTRVQTVWRGRLLERLDWARAHGDPSAPGFPPPERHNLYH